MTRTIPMLLAGGLLLGTVQLPANAVNASAAETPSAETRGLTRIEVSDPWVREAPPGIRLVAAYMVLANPSGRTDRLVSVRSPLAGKIEIHRMIIRNGMMDMDAIPFLTIPAKGEVKLQPGGTHLMIYGLKRELRAGDRLPLELEFEHAGTRLIDAPVRKVMGKH